MRNRIFLVILLALGLVACSKSKPAYVGKTYEGTIEGVVKISYSFLNENEFRFDISAPEEFDLNESFICHYIGIVDELEKVSPDLCKPAIKFLDGCNILETDSVFYLTGDKDRVSLADFCQIEGNGRANIYKDVMFVLFYNDKTDEIIVSPYEEIINFYATKFLNVANAEREKTGKASISTTCREDIPSLPGVRCCLKVAGDPQKAGNAVPVTESAPVQNKEEECIAILQKYYTASNEQIEAWGGKEAFQTARFILYTSCWDSQVLTSNQDFGIGDECLKVSSIVPNNKLDNSYIVSVSCGYSEEIPTCVVMTKDGANWKIDNIAMPPYNNALIDYSRPASDYYAYPDCGGDVIVE